MKKKYRNTVKKNQIETEESRYRGMERNKEKGVFLACILETSSRKLILTVRTAFLLHQFIPLLSKK